MSFTGLPTLGQSAVKASPCVHTHREARRPCAAFPHALSLAAALPRKPGLSLESRLAEDVLQASVAPLSPGIGYEHQPIRLPFGC